MGIIAEIDVGNEFYHRLANRDSRQGAGDHTAVEFREKYLEFLDNEEMWKSNDVSIVLNFENVKKMGPSFANEAFAYFTKYASPAKVKKIIKLIKISKVQSLIVDKELDTGYSKISRYL